MNQAESAESSEKTRFFVDLVEPDHRTSGRPVMVSDDCVSAGLVDEWLQVRNELSIEIFCGTPPFRRSPGLPRLNASSTASSGDTGAFRGVLASLRFRGCGAPHRRPTLDAEEVHGRQARLIAPLIEPLRQPSLSRLPKARGGLSEKISILSASATCSHSSTGSVRASRKAAAARSAMNQNKAVSADSA
jgi:hypothetical protein